MYRWLTPLMFIVGCDDHIFSGGAGHSVELTGGGGIEDVQAIIDAQCLACHGGSGGLSLENDLCDATVNVSANGYAGTLIVPGDHQASIFWHKSANTGDYGQGMPIPGGLSAAETQVLAEWIDAGASCQTESAEPSQPDSPPDTGEQPGEYAAIVTTFQSYYCASCHGNMGPDLTDYSDVIRAKAGDYMAQGTDVDGVMPWVTPNDLESSYLYHKIAGTYASVGGSGDTMPTGGAVTGDDLQLIADWILAGAPE